MGDVLPRSSLDFNDVNNSSLINTLKNTDYFNIYDNAYADILDKWLPVYDDFIKKGDQFTFVKHVHFYHPLRNRYMLTQVFVSNYNRGCFFEGVFEGDALLKNWIKTEYTAELGMEIPVVNLNDGNFSPTPIQHGVFKGNFSYHGVKNREKLYEMMVHFSFVTEKELLILNSLTRKDVKNLVPIRFV